MTELSNLIRDTGRTSWTNWHETVKKQQIERFVDIWNDVPETADLQSYNATTKAFQSLITQALTSKTELRGLGGGWSWSKVAATTGTLVNTKPLNYRFRFSCDDVHSQSEFVGRPELLLFVQCGTSIADLNSYLQRHDMSLKTTGSSNGQTIVGAISTGTHGSAFNVGAIQDCVRAIHLIPSDRESVWIEPASRPTASNSVPRTLKARVIRDDDMFNAALVSFGNFGIIHGVVIEVEKLFHLQIYWRQCPYGDALWDAILSLSLETPRFDADFLESVFHTSNLPAANLLHHFDVMINPHDDEGHAYVRAMYKREEPWTGPQIRSLPASSIGPGDSLSEVSAVITDLAPFLSPHVSSIILNAEFKQLEGVSGTQGEVFTDTFTRGRTVSTGMGIPLGRAREAVKIAIEEIKACSAPAIVALRFVRSSQAILASTRHAPITCVLEIDGPNSNRVTNMYERLWARLDEIKPPIKYTFHVGKMHNLNVKNICRRYPACALRKWVTCREALFDRVELREVFANDLLRCMGMHNSADSTWLREIAGDCSDE